MFIKYVRQQPKMFYGNRLQKYRLQDCYYVVFGVLRSKRIAFF